MRSHKHNYLLIAVAFAQLTCANVATVRSSGPRVQSFNDINTNGMATIVGTVSDELGSRMAGTVIQLFWNTTPDALKPDTGAVVDNENKYRLINIVPGEYRIKATMLGCKTQQVPELHVNRNQLIVVDFVLDTITVHSIE